MPDIGNVARKQRPCVAPVAAIVVGDLAGARRRRDPGLVAPGGRVVDPVRRIGDHEVRPGAVQQPRHVVRRGGVAAEQAMRAEPPQVAWPGHGVDRRRFAHDVLVGPLALPVRQRQQPVQLAAIEAREIEVEVQVVERLQLGSEQLVIPPGQFGQAVIRDAIGADLRRGQVAKPDDRHLGQAQIPSRQQPAMAGDDLAVVGDHHRRRPAELEHARRRSWRSGRWSGCGRSWRRAAGARRATARSARAGNTTRSRAMSLEEKNELPPRRWIRGWIRLAPAGPEATRKPPWSPA